MSSLLQIEKLTIGHRNKVLLRDISLEVNEGELIALTGRNGTGKTTLLRTICGLNAPESGSIFFREKNLLKLSPRERAMRISIVLTQRIALQGITVKTLVEMGRYPTAGRFHFNKKDDGMLIHTALEKLSILHLAEKPLAEISDGEMQKAMIARAFAQQTPLILMDEPTAFLDYIAKEELFLLLKQLVTNEKITIIFSSHDLELVRRYSTRTAVIENGELRIEN